MIVRCADAQVFPGQRVQHFREGQGGTLRYNSN